MVAFGSRTMIACSLSSLYEGLACQEVFFCDQHFFLSVSRGSRKRSSALMARRASLLGRAERSTPGARRSRRKARGVDGESACRATMVSGHYAANVTAFFLIPVCTEILNSDVVVMESAKDGARIDDTGPLNRARDRRVLVQRAMRSDAVVVIGIRFQNPTQMGLAQDNDVVQTLTPD
jgi:hypothetical protein